MQQTIPEAEIGRACPLCGAAGVLTNQGSFGFLAHCSECYDPDPEAPAWAHLSGKDDEPDGALEAWLDNAREYAAVDEIPAIRPKLTVERVSQPVEVVRLLPELAAQELAERERQRGWVNVPRCTCELEEGKNSDSLDFLHKRLDVFGPPEAA